MGHRGEVFSTRAAQKNRTYFFNIKENRAGDWFLNIVESKQQTAEGFERHQIVVFEEDLDDFITAMERAVNYMKNKKRKRSRARRPDEPHRSPKAGQGQAGRSEPERGQAGQARPRDHHPTRNADGDGRREQRGR